MQGEIADNSGHTDFSGDLNAAVRRIIEVVKETKKWTYVNGNPFFFQSNFDQADENRLQEALDTADEPTFAITGELQGGAKAQVPTTHQKIKKNINPNKNKPTTKIEGMISKKPLSSLLVGKKRAHLAVCLTNEHGVEKLSVMVSDYNGIRGKLANRMEDMIATIVNALRPEYELNTAAKNQK